MSTLKKKARILDLKLILFCFYFRGEEYNDKTQGIVADDEETMTFPNDIKVDKTGKLWVMNSPLPEFMITGIKKNNINFRVFMAPVRQAIKGTSCDEM